MRLSVTVLMLCLLSFSNAKGETLDEVYAKALKEGGSLTFYSTLAQVNAPIILPLFEKRFPGIKVDLVDATADQLGARAVAEARGGRTVADAFQTQLETVVRLSQQGLLLNRVPPEAAAYPNDLKGPYWVASDMLFIVPAWNTNLVGKQDEPAQFEEMADPKWKNKLAAEPRDFVLLLGLAKKKYKSDEKAIDLFKKIALNNVEFHKGHSQLAELLVAGQAAVCFTCFSHHFPPRIKKGAPLGYSLAEGVSQTQATAVFKNAPHPNTAWLWARWVASEEGQKAYAAGGLTPARPLVEPLEKTRPQNIYTLTAANQKEFSKYEKIWKEIFRLR